MLQNAKKEKNHGEKSKKKEKYMLSVYPPADIVGDLYVEKLNKMPNKLLSFFVHVLYKYKYSYGCLDADIRI